MTGPSPGLHDVGSSSSSNQVSIGHPSAEEIEDYEQADLSLDNALLEDDPLEGNGKPSYSAPVFSFSYAVNNI